MLWRSTLLRLYNCVSLSRSQRHEATTGQVATVNRNALMTVMIHPPKPDGYQVREDSGDSGQAARLGLSNFMKIFFDFTYYLGVSPFHFVLETQSVTKSESFVIKSWLPQQIFCALMHFLCTLRLIAEFRETSKIGGNPDTTHPSYFFKLMLIVFMLIFKVATIKQFWMNQKRLLNVLNVVTYHTDLPIRNLKIMNAWFLRTLFVFTAILSISGLPAGKQFITPIYSWTPSLWYTKLVTLARYTFFLEGKVATMADAGATDHVLAVVMGFTMTSRHLMSFFGDLYILIIVVTPWCAAYAFDKNLSQLRTPTVWTMVTGNQSQVHHWPSILAQYNAVHELSIRVNKALGSLMVLFVIQWTLVYSINMDQVIVTGDPYRRSHLIYLYVNMAAVLMFSADICFRAQGIRRWIDQISITELAIIPANEITLVLHGLLERTIGIQGSERFTITYGFVATFASLTVTYFIICIEYVIKPITQ